MLVLNSFGPAFGLPDASPFVIKTMCHLAMAKAEWKNNPRFDSRKAPYKKLPMLEDGNNVVADSEKIQHYLESKYAIDFDEPLNTDQRAHSRSLVRMVEEHLYFCGVRDRWMNEQTWQEVKTLFFAELPPVLGPFIAKQVRKSVIRDLMGQGVGRYDYDEMIDRAERDISAIEHTLADNDFLFGNQATNADASVSSVLATISVNPTETALKQAVCSKPNLLNYIDRMKTTFYPSSS